MGAFYNFLFIGFPYAAVAVFVVGSIYRYRATRYKYSALSAQFLEMRKGFWGTIPFHWGILAILLGHLTAFLVPSSILFWNGDPLRLIILETTGFIFGLSVLVGLGSLFSRRLTDARVRAVTSRMDIVIEVLLLLQVFLGLWTALGFRWGSSWFAADLSPYLWSQVTQTPKTDPVVAMPLVVQLHIFFAFLIILLIPFSRLVHFMVAPFSYVWRPYQQVVWYWNRHHIRNAKRANDLAATHEEHYDPTGAKIGMWLFLITEFMLFGALFIVYGVYFEMHTFDFMAASKHLNVILGGVNTIVLLTSSMTMVLAITALRKSNHKLSILMLVLTLFFAALFLWIKTYEWGGKFSHHIYPNSPLIADWPNGEQIFIGLYFAMTGLHALHIVVGGILICGTISFVLAGKVTKDRITLIENVGLYWHLVDIVWIFLFPLFYLIQK